MRSYERPDELQAVFIISTDDGYAIVETAELWEEPQESAAGVFYFYYPTVIGRDRFANEEEAAAVLALRYEWCARDPETYVSRG